MTTETPAIIGALTGVVGALVVIALCYDRSLSGDARGR